MRFYKIVANGYISAIGTGAGGTEITEDEYNTISAVIKERPKSTETTDYRLTENLTWESYTVEPSHDDPDAEEILSILLGGET